MVLADDRILEYLDENGPTGPKTIADDDRVPWTSHYVGVRLRDHLAPAGLVMNAERGVYLLTDAGRQYLAGELDADNIDI
jgi:hypothetical protein